MGCVRFSFHRISAQLLVEILQDAGAEKASPASSLQVAGRCCEGDGEFPVATGASNGKGPREAAIEKFARVLLGRYGVVFRRLLERREFPDHLVRSWDESIVDGKREAKFVAVISLAASAGNNSQRQRPSVYCGPSEKCRRTTNWLR